LAGMAATIKHFPGHGSVLEDTHFANAADPRSLDELRATDLIPFGDAIAAGAEAVMMAHVAYPAIDAHPAGYSKFWIQDMLRGEYAFRGVVFSDDISMVAAETVGGIPARIAAHVDAGCELVLVCRPEAVAESLRATQGQPACPDERLALLSGRVAANWDEMLDNPQRERFLSRLATLTAPATGISA